MKGERRAHLELLVGLLSLLVQAYAWRSLRERTTELDVPTARSWSGLVAGALSTVCWMGLFDRDVAGVRTNRRRRALASVGQMALQRKALPQGNAFHRDFAIGSTVGLVAYRLRYGLLRPLPGTE